MSNSVSSQDEFLRHQLAVRDKEMADLEKKLRSELESELRAYLVVCLREGAHYAASYIERAVKNQEAKRAKLG